MKYFIKIFFLLSLSLLLITCKKDKAASPYPPPSNIDSTPQSVYDYGYFLPGTYWVYQDSVSGILDSVYVYYSNKGKDTLDIGDGPKVYDWFQVNTYSTFEDYNYYIKFHATWSGKNPRRDKLFYTKTKPGDYVGEIILCELPVVIGNVLYNWQSNNVTTTVDFFNSYYLQSQNHIDVIKTNQSVDVLEENYNSFYYISKGIGIIRKELPDSNQFWNLIRQNIIQ